MSRKGRSFTLWTDSSYKINRNLMLKITTQTNDARAVLELEGKLAGAWVEELKNCWHRMDRPIRVQLKAVTFIDSAGRALLAEMYREGAELAAEGCMTKAIVEEITQGRT